MEDRLERQMLVITHKINHAARELFNTPSGFERETIISRLDALVEERARLRRLSVEL